MRVLVSILSRQTVVQASLIQEAQPDFIIFVSTKLARDNRWEKNLPLLTQLSDRKVPYVNIKVRKGSSLSDIINLIKTEIKAKFAETPFDEVYFDASSGKGIHRIILSWYLKHFTTKRSLRFFVVYFDLDTRKINKIEIAEKSFREHKTSVSIDWHLKERLTLYGAELTDYLPILDEQNNYFAESEEQFDELYTTLCNSMNLRAFFSSYDSIKSTLELKREYKNFMAESFRTEQIDKFVQRIFGVMPHLRPEINEAKNRIRAAVEGFFERMIHDSELSQPSKSADHKEAEDRFRKEYFSEILRLVKNEIHPHTGDIDKTELDSDIRHFMEVLFDKISSKINDISDSRSVEIDTVTFNRFKQKYIYDIERESTRDMRSLISIIFEKIVSYAVYAALKEHPQLRESIASVYQNVKLSGKSTTVIEIDTLVVFKNGYLHIFEAKSSHVSNKDLNSRLLVIKNYLGESVGMDIVFPFTANDIQLFSERNEPFKRKFKSKGLASAAGWGTFFNTTDKKITPVDKIAERLLELSVAYN